MWQYVKKKKDNDRRNKQTSGRVNEGRGMRDEG